jgi:CrcB protein
MSPAAWIAFVAAGAAGAPVRYLVDGQIGDRTHGVFPWGTFLINVTGSLLLGLLTGLALHHGLPNTPKVVVGTGFCGAYTTFSTYTFETIRLLEQGAITEAFRNALGSLLTGAVAAAAGIALSAAI